jgi:hypothetical protein
MHDHIEKALIVCRNTVEREEAKRDPLQSQIKNGKAAPLGCCLLAEGTGIRGHMDAHSMVEYPIRLRQEDLFISEISICRTCIRVASGQITLYSIIMDVPHVICRSLDGSSRHGIFGLAVVD